MSVELTHYDSYSPSSETGPYRAADYWKLPEQQPCELIYGRFCVSPAPTPMHQMVVLLLADTLLQAARKTGSLTLTAPVDVVLADHSIVQPDVLYIRPQHRQIVKDRVEGVPSLVIEVLSPGTVRRDRGEKLKLYATNGVEEYWIVDPLTQQIDFLVNHQNRFEVVLPEDALYQSRGLPEVQIQLVEFWREVDARLS